MANSEGAAPDRPQIYLLTPPELELSRFPADLARVLDAHEVACVRLALSSHDETEVSRAADACREVTHARDVALEIETHFVLADRLGLSSGAIAKLIDAGTVALSAENANYEYR